MARYLIFITRVILFFSMIISSTSSIASMNKIWTFKVFLSDKEIGQHSFQLSTINNETHVKIKADFDVYVLFFNAYSYEHTNHEIWQGHCLESIRSITNDNGKILYVSGDNNGTAMEIENQSGLQRAEGCVKSFSYWDPVFLNSKTLLNAQTGELMPVKSELIGEELIIVRGQQTPSQHYRVSTEEFTIDLWYSEQNEWLGLNSITKDGSVLRYEIQ